MPLMHWQSLWFCDSWKPKLRAQPITVAMYGSPLSAVHWTSPCVLLQTVLKKHTRQDSRTAHSRIQSVTGRLCHPLGPARCVWQGVHRPPPRVHAVRASRSRFSCGRWNFLGRSSSLQFDHKGERLPDERSKTAAGTRTF